MPLDVSWPAQRLQTVLQHAQPDLLVHSSSTATAAAAAAIIDCSAGTSSVTLLTVEELLPDWQAVAVATPAAAQQAQQMPSFANADGAHATVGSFQQQQDQQQQQQCQVAGHAQQVQNGVAALPWFYVLFTSGSTGSPVGVLGTEQGFINRYNWMQHLQQQQQTVPLQRGHVVAFKTSVGFVDHVFELLAPLLSGADMLLLPDTAAAAGDNFSASADESIAAEQQQQQGAGMPQASLVLQPQALVQLLVQHRVTHLVSWLLC
jgi:acyl-coenzyme A synthetase/AMP-(fatty) acid ligase